MRKIKLFTYAFALGLLLVSCGPPETYEKGISFYQVQKYDSALYYFDRLLPDDKEWLDSAKNMKKLCFEKIIHLHNWDLLSSAFITYGSDTSLVNPSRRKFKDELITMIKNDSLKSFFKLYDNYKTKLPSDELKAALNYRYDSFLNDFTFKGKGSLSGSIIYFKRESSDIINALSNSSQNGWIKDNKIYKEISYDKDGILKMSARIFQGGGSYFGKGGSITLIGKDSVKVNYGKALRNEIVYFIRDKKKTPVQ
jgi:hypothetical protein